MIRIGPTPSLAVLADAALVQQNTTGYFPGTESGGVEHTTLSQALGTPAQAGNLLVAIITTASEQANDHITQSVVISDTNTNSWTLLKFVGVVGQGGNTSYSGISTTVTVGVNSTIQTLTSAINIIQGQTLKFLTANVTAKVTSASGANPVVFNQTVNSTTNEVVQSLDAYQILVGYSYNCKAGITTVTMDATGSDMKFNDCALDFYEFAGIVNTGDPFQGSSHTPTQPSIPSLLSIGIQTYSIAQKSTVLFIYSNEADVRNPYTVPSGSTLTYERDLHIDITSYQLNYPIGIVSGSFGASAPGVQNFMIASVAFQQQK